MCSLCFLCIMSFHIIGDIILGWQLLLETCLLPEPRNTDSQELDHSIPKLLQTFSEAAELCNLIKGKYNPPFIFDPSQNSLSFLFQSQMTASCPLLWMSTSRPPVISHLSTCGLSTAPGFLLPPASSTKLQASSFNSVPKIYKLNLILA